VRPAAWFAAAVLGDGPLATAAALALVKARTDLLGAGDVAVRSPVSATGRTITLTRGDDYLSANGEALRFTFAAGAVRDLAGATIRFTARDATSDAVLAAVTGSVVQSGAGEQIVDVELLGSQTKALPVGKPAALFDVEADFGAGGYKTLVRGAVNVDRDETRH
jgi:hypothetical protein